MTKENREVYGSYDRSEETVSAIEKLKEEGYTKEEIRVYSTQKDEKDESLWDKVVDFFTPDSYDYDTESKNPNYRKENDVLYPHRQDLEKGNRVIVLDKANENQTRVNI